MKKKLASFLFLSSLSVSSAFASSDLKEDSWIIRARAIHVKTDINSRVSGLDGHVAATSNTIPELDFTRFFTKNIAAELILGTSKHDMYLKGSPALGDKTKLGSVKLLPPTLTLQYHLNPTGTFRPYVGSGVNYTFFYGTKTEGVVTKMKYNDGFGFALQAGLDYMISEKVSVNFDVKKIYLKTKVRANDAYTANAKLNPWLVGFGIGYHF
ncbi:MAG: OmpW family protein [Pelagibacterales bacterium]|nr:OmpW family protein [Pelagibacterales bacterium]